MEHWNSYWHQTKSLNSFAEDESSPGYNGAVLDYWHQLFASFPTGSTILDVATGNGALAVSLVDFSNTVKANFQVLASDLAAIQPLSTIAAQPDVLKLLRQVCFYSETPTEQLPFAQNSLDAVISQFGFEYSKRKAAMQEVLRVLKPTGSFSAMIHHRSSVLTKDCESGLAFYSDVADCHFFAVATELLTIADSEPKQLSSQQRTQYLNKKLFKLAQDLQGICVNTTKEYWCQDFLQRVSPLFMQVKPGHLQLLKRFQHDILSHEARLNDQLASAWSEQDAEDFSACVLRAGHQSNISPFLLDNDLFGWTLKMTK
ncbi:methyltransferase domain-containing protein [Alkalimonas collagenimarina]|uniref:Methyltransferase domain-containing protein n=1 Tax=Alkalimonas collagenimarina TaxID=400390 RepID=A0ABT9GV69_9GAMM|nr:methyltransferase domain-containing protein [Alkalimonas collagenimarina]MDP4534950.1 methyltransferase domain-containing protein [Alkalimonas collagenimarina]